MGFIGNPLYSIPSYSPAREWGFASCCHLTLPLTRVAGSRRGRPKAGLASLPASTINISANTPAKIGLAILPPKARVLLDGQPVGPIVSVPVGRHTITLTTVDSEMPSGVLVPGTSQPPSVR